MTGAAVLARIAAGRRLEAGRVELAAALADWARLAQRDQGGEDAR